MTIPNTMPRLYRISRKHVVPGTTVVLLSDTTKMDCPSWGIPAITYCPWAGECRFFCYAKKGKYNLKCVLAAQKARADWTLDCLHNDRADEWISTMVAAIEATGTRYFRIHDSGDFFSPAYIGFWEVVCNLLPNIKFWAPTKSYRGPAKIRAALELIATLPNVAIRPSADGVDAPIPTIPGLHAGTAVVSSGQNCYAQTSHGNCGPCRACWDQKDLHITYKLH